MIRLLMAGGILACVLCGTAKAQVVTVAGGVLENVVSVGRVLDSTINQGQFTALSTALTNLQEILAGTPGPQGVLTAAQAATANTNGLTIAETNNPAYPLSYTVPGQVAQPNFAYNGSDLLSLNPNGGGQALYRPIEGLTLSQWPENYSPMTAMEQKTDKAVSIFLQTSTNLDRLRLDMVAAENNLRRANSLAAIEAINAQINATKAEMSRQVYLRTAALQDVQLLQIANENNRLKREQAIAEEQSVDHQKQIGNGGGIGQVSGLLATAINLIVSTVPNGGIQ